MKALSDLGERDAVPAPDWCAPLPSIHPPSEFIVPGVFPEVEIGSSSGEDAPPATESTQLARQNLQLRTRVNALVTQSKSLQQANDTLAYTRSGNAGAHSRRR
jgi:hypothetical protein